MMLPRVTPDEEKKMNGNDLLEFEENNTEELFISFVKKNKVLWARFKESQEEYFIETYGDKWSAHVLDEYNSFNSDQPINTEKKDGYKT